VPGGTPAATHARLGRTLFRRAKRAAVALAAAAVNPPAVHYLNRLSDDLFVLSRALNARAMCCVCQVPPHSAVGGGGADQGAVSSL
jgi:cob(I)alamin adenosyltransferase